LPRIPALFLLLLVTALPAIADPCRGHLVFRSWSQDRGEASFEVGQAVEAQAGENVHLYLFARAKGATSYPTVATIGYPNEFGFKESMAQVLPHVRMEAQNEEDKGTGRIRFRAEAPGETALGFLIEDVVKPGRIDQLPQACRKGRVRVSVVAPPPPPAPVAPGPALSAEDAARQLVSLLYTGLLRRAGARQLDESFVVEVQQRHHEGLRKVAEIMLESQEFRTDALTRTRERYPRIKDPGRLRESLLLDIYRSLYGPADPPRGKLEEDLEDLDLCFSGKTWQIETCGRLGRRLVTSPLFDQRQRAALDALATAPPPPPEPPQTPPAEPGG
jgi:hypothetical protein